MRQKKKEGNKKCEGNDNVLTGLKRGGEAMSLQVVQLWDGDISKKWDGEN
jgi:hypothetical protein